MTCSLLVSDLHLTDSPDDEYRWALFPWLASVAQKRKVRTIFYLGDLTDQKDRHTARLVNRVVDNLHLPHAAGVTRSFILRGNHDGIDPENAYFRFLGKYPDFSYVPIPTAFPMEGSEVLMLPHSRDPMQDWESVEMEKADVLLMHATVRGSLAENGQALDGIPPACLLRARKAKIYSGDVHVPQKICRVEYVGAPYPIRFGDKFKGRVILLDGWKYSGDLNPPSIQRRTITVGCGGLTAEDLKGVSPDDQIKVRIRLSPSEFGDWQRSKEATMKACEAAGVVLADTELEHAEQPSVAKIEARSGEVQVKPEKILVSFCTAHKIEKRTASVGARLLKEATK